MKLVNRSGRKLAQQNNESLVNRVPLARCLRSSGTVRRAVFSQQSFQFGWMRHEIARKDSSTRFLLPLSSAVRSRSTNRRCSPSCKTKPALVILGTYQMGTPGKNVLNPRVAEISISERQKQIAELIERLKTFKPTKIVLECDFEDSGKVQVRQVLLG